MLGRKGFTLIELLVVIAIIAVLAAMLMPALWRARLAARMASCQHNGHNLGLALAMSRQARNGEWPAYFEPDAGCNRYCNVWGRLMDGGYMDDLEVFACPVAGNQLQRQDITPDWYTARYGEADDAGDYEDVLNAAYGWDNGRLAKNSRPGRVVTADNLERVWMDGYGGALTGDAYAGPNHPDDSANVLFVDGAVANVRPDCAHLLWQIEGRDVWRRGYMQNPRLDVGDDPFLPADSDLLENDPGAWDDHDDIYAIDSDTQDNMFFVESNVHWEICVEISICILKISCHVGNKADASVQPTVLCNHQTGWPAAAW